jgi:hypothetical protein
LIADGNDRETGRRFYLVLFFGFNYFYFDPTCNRRFRRWTQIFGFVLSVILAQGFENSIDFIGIRIFQDGFVSQNFRF